MPKKREGYLLDISVITAFAPGRAALPTEIAVFLEKMPTNFSYARSLYKKCRSAR